MGLVVLGCVASSSQLAAQADTETARGMVYHDANENRRFDEGERRLSGVALSNGRDVVRTDDQGEYELPLADASALFLIKPAGWRTPLSDDQLPQFFYLHKPAGSPALKYAGSEPTGALPVSINFPLYPQEEPDTFQVILFGDTQARNNAEIGYIANDGITELISSSAAFGITLGDIVFDDLSLYGRHNQTIAQLSLPWYNVIGNHDLNTDATSRKHANETFERVFGPSYYSFDYGVAHFVVLDNCDWVAAMKEQAAHYTPGFGPEQIEFLRNDLALVPDSRLVVLLMHIPIMHASDREAVFRLIESRPMCISISGHTHTHEHHFLSAAQGWHGAKPHHHIVNVTVCGSWWSGFRDERGIPHALMADGAPNGYSLLTVRPDDYRLDFRSFHRDASYQMQLSHSRDGEGAESDSVSVWANVFNGSDRSTVEMQIDDRTEWIPMERTAAEDPLFRAAVEREAALTPPVQPGLPKPGVSTHLWRASLPAGLSPGVHRITVRASIESGETATAHHLIALE